MCLIVDLDKHGVLTYFLPKLALKDIRVFKYLRKDKFNKLITPMMEKEIIFDRGICIEEVNWFGFQVRERIFHVCNDAHIGIHMDELQINKGIHSVKKRYTKFLNTYQYPGSIGYYAIIPKGTQYYIGYDNEYVSLRLIIFKRWFDYFLYKIGLKKIKQLVDQSLQ